MNDYKIKDMPSENVLITGGAGFIGSNLAHALVNLKADVTVLDALLPNYGGSLLNLKGIQDKIEFVKGDFRDLKLMKKLVKDKSLIFNCAAQVSHTISIKDPFLDIDLNCKGNMAVLEAVRQENDNAKIIYAGTRGEIGKLKYSPIDEKHPTNPVDMNGINKLAAEKYHLLYNDLYDIKTSSLRINNTYGIRHQMKSGDYGIVNWFIRRAMLNEPIKIFGKGEQTRDYNYVGDVIDAMLLAAQNKKADGEVFMLGSGKETKFIDMVKLIINTVGSGSYEQVPWPKERKAIEIGNFVVSYKKINELLGWYPKTSIEEGIKKTVEWYKPRLDDYLTKF